MSSTRKRPPGNLLQRGLLQLQYWLIGTYITVREIIVQNIVPRVRLDLEALAKRTGQTVVMTGGSRGIGLEIVKKLLQLDYTVILGDPRVEFAQKAVDQTRSQGILSGRVKLFQLDLKSLTSVRNFAASVLSSEEGKQIHVLINNAGITGPHYEVTEDGYETTFQVNYLGHFLLTNLLLDRIKKTEAECGRETPCYIMHTSSYTHTAGDLDFDELEVSKVYNMYKTYINSKLCVTINGKSLQKMLREEGLNINVYTNNPGAVPSPLWTDSGGCLKWFRGILSHICHTTHDAANSLLYPMLTSTDWGTKGGKYFSRGRAAKYNAQADNDKIAKRLWEVSVALTGK